MRQTTLPDQTAKLIELGLDKPSPKWVKDENGDYRVKTNDADYDIGELLSFLPRVISNKKFDYATINIFHDTINWVVGYVDTNDIMRFITSDIEFIDALCTMCVKLKEEGVI